MQIEKMKIQGLWSFGGDGISLEECGKQNIIIGKNNSGKSNILKLLKWVRDNQKVFAIGDSFEKNMLTCFEDPTKSDNENQSETTEFNIKVHLTKEDWEPLLQKLEKTIIARPSYFGNGNMLKFLGKGLIFNIAPDENNSSLIKTSIETFPPIMEMLNSAFTTGTHDEVNARKIWHSEIFLECRKWFFPMLAKRIRYVSGWRELTKADDLGKKFIANLNQWRSPQENHKCLKIKFDQIQHLFRKLVGIDNLTLEPVVDGQTLNLTINGRYAQINNYGDGLHQLLMIAYYLTTDPESILLIEEPENHLHPEATRHLASILKEESKGQIFITTHSPVLLDSGFADSIYRIEHDGYKSSATLCHTTTDVYKILDDLDARASDILQANCVIWVEGPTDRLFLRHCFNLMQTGFKEGIEYQCLYYGGRLRSHVTFDEALSELINLFSVSRHAAFIFDSDKASENDQIDESKSRLQQECEGNDVLCWMTEGREMENYLNNSSLNRAYQNILYNNHPNIKLGQFDKISDILQSTLQYVSEIKKWQWDYASNKTKLLPLYLEALQKNDLDHLDLKDRLSDLIRFINKANNSSVDENIR